MVDDLSFSGMHLVVNCIGTFCSTFSCLPNLSQLVGTIYLSYQSIPSGRSYLSFLLYNSIPAVGNCLFFLSVIPIIPASGNCLFFLSVIPIYPSWWELPVISIFPTNLFQLVGTTCPFYLLYQSIPIYPSWWELPVISICHTNLSYLQRVGYDLPILSVIPLYHSW